MGEAWNTLSKGDQVRLELKASVDPIFFCENEYFLGEKLYRTPKGTSQYDIIKEFFKRHPQVNQFITSLFYLLECEPLRLIFHLLLLRTNYFSYYYSRIQPLTLIFQGDLKFF